MTAELATALLALAALLASGWGVFGLCGFRHGGKDVSAHFSGRLSMALFLLVGAAFLLLVQGFLSSDFSIANVYENSHTAKPMLYKITGAWGNHEGSMLLWLWVMTAFGALLAMVGKGKMDERLFNASLLVLAFLAAGFLLFILLTSNPFARVDPVPPQGMDLNPLLQDIGLALHPPLLYIGYVGFSVVFALTIGALLSNEGITSRWAQLVQPWALLAWGFLTAGIGLGSWWAYRELGWGGWWFWDPVENISLLPWLSGTALIHCLLVLGKRPVLQNWTLLLSILTFSLSLMGTFLVRSGLLTSVHSFASDPARGMYILLFTGAVITSSLWLYAIRYPKPTAPDFMPVSREGGILVNNLLLLTACATVFLGILYPILLQVFSLPGVSVGAPYYNAIILPLALPLLIVAGIAPLLAWKRAGREVFLRQAKRAAGLAIAVAVLVVLLQRSELKMLWNMKIALFCAVAGVWLLGASIAYASREWRVHRQHLPLGSWGMLLAHGGLAVFCISAAFAGAGRIELETLLHLGETKRIAGYDVRLEKLDVQEIANFRSTKARMVFEGIEKPEGFTLYPESRFFPARRMETAEAAIDSRITRDVYAAIALPSSLAGNTGGDENVILRFYIVPAANGLWLGFVFTSIGGILAAIGRFRSAYKKSSA